MVSGAHSKKKKYKSVNRCELFPANLIFTSQRGGEGGWNRERGGRNLGIELEPSTYLTYFQITEHDQLAQLFLHPCRIGSNAERDVHQNTPITIYKG